MTRTIVEEFRFRAWLHEMIIRLFLLLFGFVLIILLLEIVFRIYWPYSEKFIESHDFYGWRLIPNQSGWAKNEGGKVFFRISSKGLRDIEYPYEKKENTFRILVLGDSYSEALQVSLRDTFHDGLESLLNSKSKELKFEVINCGVGGYGTDNELIFYRYEGVKYRPDLVILAFTIGNDVSDNFQGLAVESSKPFFLLGENGLELNNFPVKRKQSLFQDIKDFLQSHSKFFRFLYVTFRERLPLISRILNKIGLMNSAPRKVMQNGIIRNYFVFDAKSTPEWKNAWEVTKALILQVKKEAEQNHSKLLVMLIPSSSQVHENIWLHTLNEYPAMKSKSWDLSKPNQILREFFDQNKIEALDLLPRMREYANKKNEMLYFGRGHWNSEGHHLAAQLLYEYLIRNNHVPIDDK